MRGMDHRGQQPGAGASATDRTLFSVATNSPSGGGSLVYSSGAFTYTPPNLSGFITAEADTGISDCKRCYY